MGEEWHNADFVEMFYQPLYHVLYCIDVWGSTIRNDLLSILKLQKRAIRLITSSPHTSEFNPLFQSLKILSVFQVYVFKLSVLMFKFVNGDVIESIKYIYSLLIRKFMIVSHARVTNFVFPNAIKTTIQTNVRFRGIKVWNYICNVVYYDCSLSCFKCNLKECLIHFHHITKYIVASHHDDVIKWKHFPRYLPLVRRITGPRWIPLTKASEAELWCLRWSAPEQTAE